MNACAPAVSNADLPPSTIVSWIAGIALHSPTDTVDSDSAGPVPWEMSCIRRTQNGDPEAFNPIVAHYAPRIRAYLNRMVRNREEAEDLTQETFLKAFRALPRFQADRSFKRWIYTIATNTGLNALRSRNRRGMPVEVDTDQIAAREAPGGVTQHRQQPGRDEHLELALAALAPRDRQLVTLHYHEGFTLHEAGAVLGMSESAAKVALCRARRQLREKLLKGGNNAV
jgi:RNA polymerase sigma factor (sigma-70 family)